MALYIVGDIQGCFKELKALLKKVDFDPSIDQLWSVGDIVARGKKSLATVRFLMALGDSFKMVLGNHDLHLIAVYYGIREAKSADHLNKLLNAPEITDIIAWLRKQPLLLQIPNEAAYVSHAGLSPQWTISEAIEQAKFAENILQSDDFLNYLKKMYGDKPNQWHKAKNDQEKFRYTINALTRMRYCYPNGKLDFECKQAPDSFPENLLPWFTLSTQLNETSWIFGHWAALMGNCPPQNVYALDTGCVWGNYLTLLRWQDKKVFIEHAHK